MAKKKKSKNQESEESDLEEAIEEEIEEEKTSEIAEEIKDEDETTKDNEFVEFMQPPTEPSNPVLEKVAKAAEPTRLEQDIATTPAQEKKQDEPVKYKVMKEDYQAMERERQMMNRDLVVRQSEKIPAHTPTSNLRREREQEFEINPDLRELRKGSATLERDYVAKAEKIDRDGSKLPFERQDTKYQGKTFR